MSSGFAKLGNTVKGLAALVALFPAAAVIFNLVDIPPTLVQLVQVIAFSVSLIVLLAVFLLRAKIQAMPNGRAAVIGLIAVVLGAVCLTEYYQFANAHIVTIGPRPEDRLVIPLNPSAGITSRVEPFEGDYEEALNLSTQSETLKQLMKRERGSSVIVMILLLVLSQVLLIAPVVGAAWKLAGAPDMGGEEEKEKEKEKT